MSTAAITSPSIQADANTFRIEDHNRLKGFLGTANEMTAVAETISPYSVAEVRSLSDEDIIPLGVKALGDIADDILVLDEIRQRFRNHSPILGYQSWSDFVERNSKYTMRTIQNRLAEVKGKDVTKINRETGNKYTRSEGIASSCPNCGDEFPSKTQLKKHQHKEHPETTRGPQPPIDDYSKHPESHATVEGRSHGRNLERLRDVAASLGLDAHVSYDDGFKVTIDDETVSFDSEAATREFLKKAQATGDIPQEPIIELREGMRVRYDGVVYRVSQKSGVPALTLVERHEPAVVVGSDEVAA